MINSEISTILLAAGFSSRMGKLKALLPWQGIPLIQYQIEQMRKAGVNEIIVVLGYRAQLLQRIVSPFDVKTVINENYSEGKSSSIRKGASHIKHNAKGIFVSAVDQPVPSNTLQKLMKHLNITQDVAVIPVYHEKRGHPILFNGTIRNDLLAVNENTKGLRHVIQKYHKRIAYLKVNDPTILYNFNKLNDYMQHGT
ncbi:nucleotidyltransferase family protein [Lentibacillus salinarum]|uniref:NTP transferase domain-containing protein n=1 Tax=Lentibacillus salinarum TaxID=446820 RepID=A0ABW3ZQ32_9BACI